VLKKDIRVGGKYRARVGSVERTVLVERIYERPGLMQKRTVYEVLNTETGRRTTFRAASRFRSEVTA